MRNLSGNQETPLINSYSYCFRTTATDFSRCQVCYKMGRPGVFLLSDTKTIPAAFKPVIPGLNIDSKVKKASDKNLSPLLISNSKPLQYGDTSFTSISTDHPAWTPGECLLLAKYEGRFREKKNILTRQVISLII